MFGGRTYAHSCSGRCIERLSEVEVIMNAKRWAHGLVLAIVYSTAGATNVVRNPDFVGGADGWDTAGTGGGSAYFESGFGSPTAGTLRMDAFVAGSGAYAEQCVDVRRLTKLDFGYRFELVTNFGAAKHAVTLTFFDSSGCTGNALGKPLAADEGDAPPVENGYKEAMSFSNLVPVGALSAHIEISAMGGSGGQQGGVSLLVDHVQVGPLDVVFFDDFEP